MKEFKINADFITLGQLLKTEAFIGSGGQAKFFLWENNVLVNDERRTERGKKLCDGDIVKIEDTTYHIVYDSKN
ncbi:MAG: S4 domain-containing protein YaaA [Acholeplasmataceae bacterium]